MSVGKFLAGFVIGGVVGGLVGILLAPQSGDETRKVLKDKSLELKDKAQTTVSEIQMKADGIVSDIQAKGDELVNKIQDMINNKQGA